MECEELDVLREPRLIESDPYHRGKTVDQVLREIRTEWKVVTIACSRPCAFLSPNNLCQIYPTRPNACVGMEAWDEQCQMARESVGLPPLLPSE